MQKAIQTNNGLKGGLLKGKAHYDSNGNPLGGIKAVVTDQGGKPIEVEGNEVIINKKTVASEKVLTIKGTPKEILSTLNQMDGNGVAIGDEEAEILAKYRNGGELIKRADGSYSRRGLWDNIRDNVGSDRKPTKQMLEQEAKIKSKYHLGGDMSKHLAPNGKPSKLNHEQWHLVRNPEFKSWFGDWENDPETASKVLDENGEPLVVYHGTKKEFTIFGEGKNKSILPEYKDEYLYKEKTNYFHKSKKYAKTFGSKYGGYEKPFFLKIKNIEKVDEDTIEDIGYFKSIYDYYVISEGFDGIFSESGQYATLLSPNQIKLADGSNKTFDGGNDDIRFAEGGSISRMTPSELKAFYASPEGKKLDAQTYSEWKRLVNMTKSELEKFYNSVEGKKAGLTTSQAKEQGIDSGRESARWVLKMKDIPYTKWSSDMWRWAKKQINFIKRMSGMKGSLYNDKGEKTRKHTALLIWGHNPEEKFAEGGGVDNEKIKLLEDIGVDRSLLKEDEKSEKVFLGNMRASNGDNLELYAEEINLSYGSYKKFVRKITASNEKGNVVFSFWNKPDEIVILHLESSSSPYYHKLLKDKPSENILKEKLGYGTDLVNKLIDESKSLGKEKIIADDVRSLNAEKYWERLGFVIEDDNVGERVLYLDNKKFKGGGDVKGYDNFKNPILINGFISNKEIDGKEIFLITYNSGGQEGLNVHQTMNPLAMLDAVEKKTGLHTNTLQVFIYEHTENSNRIETEDELEFLKNNYTVIIVDRDSVEFYNGLKRFKGGGELSKKALAVETNDLTDFVRKYFIKDGRIDVADAMQELFGNRRGKSIADEYRKRIGLHKKGGLTISQLAHNLWEQHKDEVREGIDDSDFRNAVEEVLISEYGVSSMIKSLIEKSGESEQDKENEFWMNQFDEGDDEYYEDLSDEEVADYFKDMEGFERELAKGTEHEMEHLETLKKVAEGKLTPEEAVVETASKHLEENPRYYEDLAKMEKEHEDIVDLYDFYTQGYENTAYQFGYIPDFNGAKSIEAYSLGSIDGRDRKTEKKSIDELEKALKHEQNVTEQEESIPDLIEGLKVLADSLEGAEKKEIEDVIEGLEILLESEDKFARGGEFRMATGGKIVFKPITTPL